ncbi:peptidase C26 [Desulfotomaculum nigrificans CO-1-SRB]|uniref:Peptidase C26 n=1 Tax=Desulfotomaculum nigrificans (strain DSM 14880 / VKM B-2319 / CO-1-SRB) TaxID=868595 RepID=F6B799_DESCC|nr:gamma-glutamyl-gamma-aminobutyrate hydrolase family protein [Desulfotomaculum nigrificans]AEF93349.1 peptidase C26 [Desulfotomaculum nigrificans CO-1-SRB]
MAPIIGITSSYDQEAGQIFLPRYYIDAVAAAGGVPMVLSGVLSATMVDQILDSIDGLLLSGGVDVDPLLFGEEPEPGMGDICPERDQFELSLSRRALTMDMPLFGICRGIQVLNIAAGGTVLQDISTAVQNPLKHHQRAPRWYGTHTIKTLPGSKLAAILGGQMAVNSFHHQAVGRVAEGFKVTAWSADGVVEGIESIEHKFVLGLQCHPECMWEHDQRIFGLFKAFIAAAKISN